jgi:hypothetical protein
MMMIMSQTFDFQPAKGSKFHIIEALHTHEVNKSKKIDKLQFFVITEKERLGLAIIFYEFYDTHALQLVSRSTNLCVSLT